MTVPEAKDISPNSDGGLLKKIVKEGTGVETPPNGCKVKVHYVGTLLDGTQFDSSRDRGTPFEFSLGKGSVIKGWDLGVATMRKGEVAVLTCAPEYAYDQEGSPPSIPPNAVLNFEVEVLDWSGEDISMKQDGSIIRYQLEAGEGYSTPNEGALVEVHLLGTCNGQVFEDRDVSFNLGEGSDSGICKGIEKALEKFKKKEKSKIILQPNQAFGGEGNREFNIPANSVVEYIVILKSFEKAKESWAMDSVERMEQARLFKEKGTAYFKTEKFELAVKMYKKVITFLEHDKDMEEERKSLQLSANLNLSLCYLKLHQYYDARDAATAAIALDAISEKAYFRRGQANLALTEAEIAILDFQEVLRLEPNNKAAQAQVVACQKLIKEHLMNEKKIYANMFDKFAKVDAQKEEQERRQQPDVMKTLGEWGAEERERAPTDFEKENPNILMLNGNGEFKDM